MVFTPGVSDIPGGGGSEPWDVGRDAWLGVPVRDICFHDHSSRGFSRVGESLTPDCLWGSFFLVWCSEEISGDELVLAWGTLCWYPCQHFHDACGRVGCPQCW